jgi:hypothetical protein
MITRADIQTWTKVQRAIGDEARLLCAERGLEAVDASLRMEALEVLKSRTKDFQIDDEAAFNEFWKVYPRGRKQGKADAKRLFLKIVKGKHADLKAEPQALILGAMRYAAVMGDNHAYVVMPARWLREGRWDDEDIGFAHLDPSQKSSVMNAFDDLLNELKGVDA